MIFQEKKNYNEALADYNKAIELDDTIDYYFERRGDTKRELKDYKGAIADFTKAIELGKNCYHERAYVKINKSVKDYQGAIEDFTEAIKLAEKPYNWAFYYRGTAYEKLGKNKEAIADYDEAGKLKAAREAKVKLLEKMNAA